MNKKIFVVILIVLTLVGVSGFFIVQRFDLFKKNKLSTDSSQGMYTDTGGEEIDNTTKAQFVDPLDIELIESGQYVEYDTSNDHDADGVSDDKEKELGTDIYSADSDGDSVLDKEEIEVWKTDPKKADTDGDGYWDGFEIMNGYNPNGSGKLDQ